MENNRIENIRKRLNKLKSESLRKPSSKEKNKDGVMAVHYYGPSTTTEEEILKRYKTHLLPEISKLLNDVESCYNMYSSSAHEKESDAKKQEKELASLEEVYNHLKEAQAVIIKAISKDGMKEGLNEENPVGSAMQGISDIPVGDEFDLDVPHDSMSDNNIMGDLSSLIGELANMHSEDMMQRFRGVPENEIKTVIDILKKAVDAEKQEF